jgi:hypothetical protein
MNTRRRSLLLPIALLAAACGEDAASPGATSDAGTDAAGDAPSSVERPRCAGDPADTPAVIDEECAVFVSPLGGDVGSGTRASPFKTITKALEFAPGKRIFVCQGDYAENLVIERARDGIGIFGGFNCSSWTYSEQFKPNIKPSSGYALQVKNLARGARFEDLAFEARDATAPGESSIAVFVADSQNVAFVRTSLKAGNGANGTAGPAATTNYEGGATAPGGAAPLLATPAVGGLGGVAQCTTGRSRGGNGGPGDGSTGQPGTADPSAAAEADRDGAGGGGGASACGASARPGAHAAAPQAVAAPGALGRLTAAGWERENGVDGRTGNPGQGGGGGGGRSATQVAGSGGGAGGCGGAGGRGGQGGGASIALASYRSAVQLAGSRLVAGDGGAGGAGGAGQAGQTGGPGGSAVGSCAGETGGNGSGGGAGGAGGSSIGVAFVGAAPALDSASRIDVGRAGAGGTQGSGGAGPGQPGPAASGVRPGTAQSTLSLGN